MNVLFIEPDKILAKEYKRAFEKAGISAVFCNDAQSAITAIDKKQPKVVVLEIQLAGHSGIEFLHEFRSYEDWSGIPVIINSCIPSYALLQDASTQNIFGISRYFYKPQATTTQLIGAVKALMPKVKK